MTTTARQMHIDTQRACYRHWRRVVRDNGWYALRWMPEPVRAVWERIRAETHSMDDLVERRQIVLYCQREGITCTPMQTASRQFLARFQKMQRK